MSSTIPKVYSLKEGIRFRLENFGGLCWTHRGVLFKLSMKEAVLLCLFSKPRDIQDIDATFFEGNIDLLIKPLLRHRIIIPSRKEPVRLNENWYEDIVHEIQLNSSRNISKPFWAHLQPFTHCNLRCLHCYCCGGASGYEFVLSLKEWKEIVDRLYDFGIVELYLTGGECSICNDSLDLIEYIYEKGFITGISTNGVVISERFLRTLKRISVENIQVSLDGANRLTNDFLRGSLGSFDKVLENISRLSIITDITINTVVSQVNIGQIEGLIQVCAKLGVKRYRFFPIKACGRAIHRPEFLISWDEWCRIPFDRFAVKYSVEIDYLKNGDRCGAGTIGFALDACGDIYPCIFGMENIKLNAGNILRSGIEEIWFNSQALNDFRKISDYQPCHRCEHQ